MGSRICTDAIAEPRLPRRDVRREVDILEPSPEPIEIVLCVRVVQLAE
jgi:hypothetical protein